MDGTPLTAEEVRRDQANLRHEVRQDMSFKKSHVCVCVCVCCVGVGLLTCRPVSGTSKEKDPKGWQECSGKEAKGWTHLRSSPAA